MNVSTIPRPTCSTEWNSRLHILILRYALQIAKRPKEAKINSGSNAAELQGDAIVNATPVQGYSRKLSGVILMNDKKNMWMHQVVSSIILCLMSVGVFAETKIAILDFELKDLTLSPGIPEEIRRTASIKPLLEEELEQAGYVIISIDPESQKTADSGVGYLFDHHELAADLGKQFDADYVLVGRLHKPSFLFAYLMGHLVRVSDAKLIGNYVSESKGPNQKLTIKAVESLAVKIDKTLDKRYSKPSKQMKR